MTPTRRTVLVVSILLGLTGLTFLGVSAVAATGALMMSY